MKKIIALILVMTFVFLNVYEVFALNGEGTTIDKDVKVKDTLFFGSYEQDNDTANGKEDIEWIVLQVEDGRILVTSKCVLDVQAYSPREKKCSLGELFPEGMA